MDFKSGGEVSIFVKIQLIRNNLPKVSLYLRCQFAPADIFKEATMLWLD